MDTNIAIAVLLVAVLLLSALQAVQIAGISGMITAKAATAVGGSGGIDMTGWTENEKMNYEMHGIVPARAGAPSGSGMVGGC